MMVPHGIVETARRFWQLAGVTGPATRDLRTAVPWVLPLDVVPRPRPYVSAIRAWLKDLDVDDAIAGLPVVDRPLRACVLAREGCGLVIIDSKDPPPEQNFSLAHEIAHFLLHYVEPRTWVGQQLGVLSLEVLDGLRPPTHQERVHAVLTRTSLHAFAHLMERTTDGHLPGGAVDRAERDADLLAFELMAPSSDVLDEAGHGDTRARRGRVACLLRTTYGLPASPAAYYAAILIPFPRPGAFSSRLRTVE